MPGRMHLLGHTRHTGKPTSGRYVYRVHDGWYWQCDLHDGDEAQPDEYGPVVLTQRDAFDGAMAHARVCSELYRDVHTHRTCESRDACTSGHCDLSTIIEINGRRVVRGRAKPPCDAICDAASCGWCFTPWCKCSCHRTEGGNR